MKHVIFLGFYCQIYKKAPTARIYVGDIMIDEIDIPEYCPEEYIRDRQLTYQTNKDINNYEWKRRNLSPNELSPYIYEPIHALDSHWFVKKFSDSTFENICYKLDHLNETKKKIKHPKIFVYVIDDDILKKSQSKISIEIKNTDSNYLNGFMTKSTLLHLNIFYILPYALFKNPIKYTQRYLDFFSRESTAYDLKKLFSWYKLRTEWPTNYNHYFYVTQKKTEKKAIENIVGGDATYQIEIKKKYNLYWPKNLDTKGFFWFNRFFIKDFVVPLSNKYKQHENQRNSD